jgi:hypothetical protein
MASVEDENYQRTRGGWREVGKQESTLGDEERLEGDALDATTMPETWLVRTSQQLPLSAVLRSRVLQR